MPKGGRKGRCNPSYARYPGVTRSTAVGVGTQKGGFFGNPFKKKTWKKVGKAFKSAFSAKTFSKINKIAKIMAKKIPGVEEIEEATGITPLWYMDKIEHELKKSKAKPKQKQQVRAKAKQIYQEERRKRMAAQRRQG
jgi:hypothetical protein